jgi:hypothetical protein
MRAMVRPPKRFKGSLQIWLADLAAERAAGEVDAVIRTRAQKVIDIWNAGERQTPLGLRLQSDRIRLRQAGFAT